MPFYKFICSDCGAENEIMASMEEKDSMKSEKFVCGTCGSKKLEYILDFAGYGGDNDAGESCCRGGNEAPPCASGKCPFA